MASWPTYDPNIWVGGISSKDYKSITSKKHNYPQPVAGVPGRVRAGVDVQGRVTLPAAVKAGYSLNGSYHCPSSYSIGGHAEGATTSRRATASISMLPRDPGVLRHGLLQVRLRDLAADGRAAPEEERQGPVHQDGQGVRARPAHRPRPAERVGRPDRRPGLEAGLLEGDQGLLLRARRRPATRRSRSKDPQRAAYLLQLSKENCVDGWAYRGGDAANFAIGQGDTTTTPLQMARVYAAVANGGTLVTPHIGRACHPGRQAGPPDRARSPPGGSR